MKKQFTILFFLISLFGFSQNTNWSNGVGKIIYENCATCHKTGGIAPFSLTSYEEAAIYAQSIRYALSEGSMPPWSPDPKYKNFVHQRVMKDADKQAVISWIDNNTPAGDLRYAPTPIIPTTKSKLGTPDLSFKTPKFTVTSNSDMYRVFELPSGLTQTTFIKAFEVIPGNSQIVHHVLVFQDSSTNPIDPNSAGGTGSDASKLLFGYTPGAQPYFTPVGAGFKLDANTRILVQIHYAPGSKGMSDETTVNFKTTTATQREISVTPVLNHSKSLINGPLFIPANETKTFDAQFKSPGKATLLFVFPHMHQVGKSIETYGETATGEKIPFIKIPKWDFHWQDSFVFTKSVVIPSGTTLKSTAFYDNTTNNLDNPSNPPIDVKLGEGSNDEMMLIYFAFMPYQVGDENLIVDDRITPNGNTTFCEGQSVVLNAINESGYTYQWYKDDVLIDNATSSSYEAKTAGKYKVSLTLGTKTTVTEPIEVIVNPTPVLTITPNANITLPQNGNVELKINSNGNFSYQWYKDEQPIMNANATSYLANAVGNYSVAINEGCIGVSNSVSVTEALAINDFNIENKIAIFPNPSSGSFNIKNAIDHQLTIFNLLGQQVKTVEITSNEHQITLIDKGIYLLKISNSIGENFYQKLIIE